MLSLVIIIMWGGEQKQIGNVDKIKFPHDLQPFDKYLRQAECHIPPGDSQLS